MGRVQSFSRAFFKYITAVTLWCFHLWNLNCHGIKDFLRATYTAKQIEIRITFRCTELGEVNPCVKKSQKKHKIWNGKTTALIITSVMAQFCTQLTLNIFKEAQVGISGLGCRINRTSRRQKKTHEFVLFFPKNV